MEHRDFTPGSALIHVAGLAHSDYDLIRESIEPGMPLELRAVRDNPYDPNAVEVWCRCASGAHRVGFVPRDLAPGLRRVLAISPGAQGRVHCAGPSLSFYFTADTPEIFEALWPLELMDDPADAVMAGYRSFFLGERVDSEAPDDYDALIDPMVQRLRSEGSDLDEDDLRDEAPEAMVTWWELRPEPACDAPSAEQKFGGLPYAEQGWGWPVCPCCGSEVVFVAQMRDPMNPDDLVQLFECKDPDFDLCHQWAQEDPKSYSLVRLWRDPSGDRLHPIAPTDPGDVLPGFTVLRMDSEGDPREVPSIPTGGPATALAVQGLENEGWHCVFRAWLPDSACGLLHTDICVARHGRGQVIAFDDHG